LPAATVISTGYYTTDYTNSSYQECWLKVRPVRVG
jgi:hypothetical protein